MLSLQMLQYNVLVLSLDGSLVARSLALSIAHLIARPMGPPLARWIDRSIASWIARSIPLDRAVSNSSEWIRLQIQTSNKTCLVGDSIMPALELFYVADVYCIVGSDYQVPRPKAPNQFNSFGGLRLRALGIPQTTIYIGNGIAGPIHLQPPAHLHTCRRCNHFV